MARVALGKSLHSLSNSLGFWSKEQAVKSKAKRPPPFATQGKQSAGATLKWAGRPFEAPLAEGRSG